MKCKIVCNALIILTIALFSQTAFGQGKPIVLKLAHITQEGGMIDKHAKKFAELVSLKTQNRVKANVFPAQQLGNVTEILEGISMGSIDMGLEGHVFLEMFEKDFAVYAIPFLMSRDEIIKSEHLKEIYEKVRVNRNIRTLPGWAWRPAMHMWTQKRIVKTPDELQGIKIRLWQQKSQIDMWNALGATATPLPWGELYMALAQKIVNGMVHNTVQVKEEKFYEQLDYCTLLDFSPATSALWINDKLYSRLPGDLQKAINESAVESGKYFTDLAQSLELESRQAMEKHGLKFIDTDRKVWVQKAITIHKKLETEGAWSKGLLKKLGYE